MESFDWQERIRMSLRGCFEDYARAQCDDERVRGNAAVSTTEKYTARLNAVHLYVHVHRVLSHIDSTPNFTAEIVSMHDQ